MFQPYHYLNVNSTQAPYTGYYNPSDLGYENMRILRAEKNKTLDEIKRFVNAPVNAKVIVNSGATESIATCINWAKHNNKYGTIYGTSFDHSSVKANCLNQDMKYKVLEQPSEESSKSEKSEKMSIDLPDDASAVFITHVSSKTGEIIDPAYLNMIKRIHSQQLAKNEFDSMNSNGLVPYHPLVFVDATQSITKIPIDMNEMRANALFFSLHKIGGPLNTGVLIISDDSIPFVPLIAGEQNNGLRGGTLNDLALVSNRNLFKTGPTPESRMKDWNNAVRKLEAEGIKVRKPKGKHLYSTLLIETNEACSLGIIDALARENVYVGTTSACANESIFENGKDGEVEGSEKNNKSNLIGGNPDRNDRGLIRISFTDPGELDDDAVSKIASAVNRK